MEYREYPVPEMLAAHVQCVWRLRDAAPSAGTHTIYPDGRCELICHLATPPRRKDAQGWHVQTPNLFAGQCVSAIRLEPAGALDCIGVRLTPAASGLVVPRTLAKLRDRVVDLAEIHPEFCKALRAAARAFAAGNEAALWRILSKRCATYAIDPRIEAAVNRLESTDGKARIESVARAVALRMRGFQTLFRARVGMAPKEFARLLRLQATLRALDANNTPLADLAADSGFSDQAHATRELKRATGLTPARLRAELLRDRNGDTAIRMAAAFVRGHS